MLNKLRGSSMPEGVYVTFGDCAYPLKSLLDKRLINEQSTCIVRPLEREDTFFVEMTSGDFCVVSKTFAFRTKNGLMALNESGNRDVKIQLSQLPKKHLPSFGCLKKEPSVAVRFLDSLLKKGQKIGYSSEINDSIWAIYLHGYRFRLSNYSTMGIRALCELYGFNVVEKDKWFRLKFRRKKETTMKRFSWFKAQVQSNMATCLTVKGNDVSRQGF